MASPENPLRRLALDPSGWLLGLNLPPGSLMDQTIDGEVWHEPLLWLSDSPALPGSWSTLLPARRAGLQPVLIGPDLGIHDGSDLNPQLSPWPGDPDAEAVLAGFWHSYNWPEPQADEDLSESKTGPFGPRWPGLAPPGTPASESDPDIAADRLARALIEPGPDQLAYNGEHARIALVPALHSADIPAAIGWTGASNAQRDAPHLSTVLRSWEERFGVRLVAVDGAALHLSVTAPPGTCAAAEHVAAEHLAFCPGVIADGGWWSYRQYAESLLTSTHWTFWWD
ncbi:DUF4253 domain-containing protein [Streptomyces justiciae]|nr:DUF4253 domain-containing protein [Streptomyces justiciae]